MQTIDGNSTASVGFDPELPMEQQELKEIKWQPIIEMAEDKQVSEVIKALNLEM